MPQDFKALTRIFIDLIEITLPVVASLALLVFIWGLVKFIFKVGGDEKAVTEGKNLMIWGVIALFILVSFMAIIEVFQSDLGVGEGGPLLPTRSAEDTP